MPRSTRGSATARPFNRARGWQRTWWGGLGRVWLTPEARAGLYFVVFNPTSDDLHRNRLAMDGVLPGGRRLPLAPRDPGQGFNSVLTTTHRQSFLVPPRRHRAFPLAEMLQG